MTDRILLSAVLAMTVVGLHARADEVWVKGQDKSIKGEVKLESARDVHVQVSKKTDSLVGANVIDIQYDNVKPAALSLSGGEYRLAKTAEKEARDTSDTAKHKSALRKAIENYSETLKKMEKNQYAARHFEYKVAVLTLELANLEGLKIDTALAKLQNFKTRFPNSWQINHVMPKIANLQLDTKDYKGAELTFQEIAEMDVFPDDVRRDAELMVVQVMVRAGNIEQANKKLAALAIKAGANAVFAARVKMAKAEVLVGLKKIDEAIPLLQQVIRENNDKNIKALAHNTLGECLFKAARYNEALWEFLWVDSVYNQDKTQRAKALYFLWRTFEQLNNAERAQECRETLVSDAQYAGTEYQRLASAKSK
jgi:tetratricopeptide (TPR) repeat protein